MNPVAPFRTIPAGNTAILSFRAKLEDYDLLQRWEFDPAKPTNELIGTMVRLVPLVGVVTDSQDKPVAEATVSVFGDGHQSEGFRGTVNSQADGKFQILVKPNHYYVLAAAQGKSASPINRLILRSGQPTEPVKLVLQPATRIHGTLISSADGKPLGDRFVSLRSDDGLYYHKLPKEQQLPNPLDDRTSLSPALYQSMRSAPQGEFEFFVGPGSFSLSSQVDPRVSKYSPRANRICLLPCGRRKSGRRRSSDGSSVQTIQNVALPK